MSMATIGRSLAWLATGVVLAVAVMLATQGWRGSEAVVLRSYEVNPDIAAEVSTALRTVLAGGKDRRGFPAVIEVARSIRAQQAVSCR